MYSFTVLMGLTDYVPVAFFGVTMVVLLRDFYGRMVKGAYALFAAGCVNVFAAGFLKATWKLLYAAGICDFAVLNTLFLPTQAIGFLLLGLGLVGLFLPKKAAVTLAVAPPVFSGSMVFIGLMVAGLAALCGSLGVLAAKMKKGALIAVFILSFVCYLGMGYMSSQDSASAAVNWIEQGINTLGQGLLMAGALVLHKAGLKEYLAKN